MSVDGYGHSASHGALTGLGLDDHPQYYGDGLGRPLKRDGKLIVPSTRGPNNLIRNGGFEDSDTDVPWWWFIPAGGRWGVQSHPITADSNHSGGTNNLYHDLPGSANLGYGYALQTGYAGDPMPGSIQNNPMTDAIQCDPGDMFRLSVLCGSRGTGFSGSGTAARINFYDKHGGFLPSASGPYVSPANHGSSPLATRLECIGVAPADAAYVVPGVIVHTNTYATGGDFAAAFHYDDFVLTYMGENWRNVGDSGEPGFLSSWVNYGSTHAICSFRRTGSGDVQLRGLIKGGVGRNIFYLPSGYQPEYDQIFTHIRANSVGELRINAATSTDPGMVYSYSGYDATWMSLAGIHFTPRG